jgi:hypothetical protein
LPRSRFPKWVRSVQASPPYRYRELQGSIDKELFDLPKMLILGKKHQVSEVLSTNDREDSQRFVTTLESRIHPDES